jgi:hypothetical protein
MSLAAWPLGKVGLRRGGSLLHLARLWVVALPAARAVLVIAFVLIIWNAGIVDLLLILLAIGLLIQAVGRLLRPGRS